MASRDFFVHQNYVMMDKFYPLFKGVGSLENKILKDRLKPIKKPVFVCGLARSGTSIVTRMLHSHKDLGSLVYQDLPLLCMPYFWNFVSSWYYHGVKPQLRPHQDGLQVDPQTPDAFEEFLWRKELDDYQKDHFSDWLDQDFEAPSLEFALRPLMQKTMFIRGSNRYLSKGNYNLFRLKYLAKLFPDAQFIICLRDPFEQAHSLARVHEVFMEAFETNPYVGEQMTLLGHYEFGPARKPIGEGVKQQSAWNKGLNYEGYLHQWLATYQGVYEYYLQDKPFKKQILVFENETLQKHPLQAIQQLFDFCELKLTKTQLKTLSKKVNQTNHYNACEKIPSKLKKEVEALYAKLKKHA